MLFKNAQSSTLGDGGEGERSESFFQGNFLFHIEVIQKYANSKFLSTLNDF